MRSYCLDLFANRPAYHGFQTRALDIFAQRGIDHRLVVPTASAIHDVLEMLDDIVVEANRYSSLSRRRRHNRATLGLAEIVFPFHLCFPSYCDRSRRVALRAEMILIPVPRTA